MPFDDIDYPARRPSGVAAAANVATTVWLATHGSGEDGDEWDVEYIFATEAAAKAYAERPRRERWKDCDVVEWDVMPSWPPVAVPAVEPTRQPPKPSGVNFAFALAADVVRCVAQIENERHDAATCCGERQERAGDS